GLSDGDEVNLYTTDPNDPDTDDDGLSDGDEVNLYTTDPNDSDTDDDGVADKIEIIKGSDPLDANSTPDNISDDSTDDNSSDDFNPFSDLSIPGYNFGFVVIAVFGSVFILFNRKHGLIINKPFPRTITDHSLKS
ncbi:MAG: hypothetical protein DRO88_13010, partial [Promethearchaeia archaeon]